MIRNVGAMNSINDAAHSRSLIESTMLPEIILALQDWTTIGSGGVLVGTAALSFHVRPRMTQELQFLCLGNAAVPDEVSDFTRVSPLLFRHARTSVEVHVVTTAVIEVPIEIAEEVVRTAITSDGVCVASESGLVALKLFRNSHQDEADIMALVKTGRVDLSNFSLPLEKMSAFRELVEVAKTDPHPP